MNLFYFFAGCGFAVVAASIGFNCAIIYSTLTKAK